MPVALPTPDTYETYVGYYNWMLAQKAKEDAELQKQIEEYTAQGKQASIVEDMSGKWAVPCHFRKPLAARASLPITQPVRL